MQKIKIRNKRTGEIRHVFENDLINFKLGGQVNKTGIKNFLWNNTYLSKKQEGGKGVLNTYPQMNGSIPVALVNIKGKLYPVKTIDNRTVSMDDMFTKDSVQVNKDKAVRLKKYIK